MVSVLSLWLPILLSGVAVFIVGSVIHMVLKYHASDLAQLPQEEAIRDALKPLAIPPGEYVLPYGGSMEALKDPDFVEKMKEGPVAYVTVVKNGPPNMGPRLMQWFVFSVVVSVFAGYVASVSLGAGARYLDVFQVVGTVAFVGYALGMLQDTIWMGKKWSTTLKSVFDGLIYGLVTAGVFGWLWP